MEVGIVTERLDRSKRGGLENYTKLLIENILKNKNGHNISLIHYRKYSDPLYSKAKEIIIPLRLIPPRKVISNIMASHYLNEIEVLHIPVPTTSENTLFLLHDAKKVLTIHDLRYFSQYQSLKMNPNLKEWFYAKPWKLTLQLIKNRIDRVIAVSKSTKRDILKYLKIPEEKIRVIYEAPDEKFRRISVEIPNYIDSPFILSNNIDSTLIEIYHKLRKKGLKHKLVVFGMRKAYMNKLGRMFEELNLYKDIILAGYVSDEELVKLYNTASLFIRNFQYEGFGLPPLEAMACGCPVVASNIGALPEVIGDAGILAKPYGIDEWVEAMYEVLTNEGLRQDLIKKGLKRAKMFSWEKAAEETYKVYEEVYAQ
jgi:glycosyltransferase involved in cell wall biosynthesis